MRSVAVMRERNYGAGIAMRVVVYACVCSERAWFVGRVKRLHMVFLGLRKV